MGGFRRAQLHGSEELFRSSDAAAAEQDLDLPMGEVTVAGTVTKAAPLDGGISVVPSAPSHDSRSLRLNADEIEIIADALQYLKFPNKSPARPSVDEFERLEELRQKLLESL